MCARNSAADVGEAPAGLLAHVTGHVASPLARGASSGRRAALPLRSPPSTGVSEKEARGSTRARVAVSLCARMCGCKTLCACVYLCVRCLELLVPKLRVPMHSGWVLARARGLRAATERKTAKTESKTRGGEDVLAGRSLLAQVSAG